MRSRTDLVAIFTTFLSFEDGQTSAWQAEPRLKRNLQRVLEKLEIPSIDATYLVTYWHQQYQPLATNLPRLHLFAYVQEPCYWAAHRLSQRIASSSTMALYSLSDCFQIAIVDFPKILAKFDSSRGASLATYAEIAFSSVIRDTLRQRRELDICSDWSLVRRISKKRLIEALAQQGFSATQIEHYSLAWFCFRELWVPEPHGQRSSSPPEGIWVAVAEAYRQVKSIGQPDASPAQLEQWLQQTGKLLRNYLYPQASSLNETLPGFEGRERLDSLVDSVFASSDRSVSDDDSPLGQLIAQEEQQLAQSQQLQIQAVLDRGLQSLKPDWQTALQLYYQQNRTQTQIAQQMNCSQPSVARYLIKGREALLVTLVGWAKTELNIVPNPEHIGEHSEALEEWLQLYYGRMGANPGAVNAGETSPSPLPDALLASR
jgi:RNA polymerase sigma factor (sigma-70 family)